MSLASALHPVVWAAPPATSSAPAPEAETEAETEAEAEAEGPETPATPSDEPKTAGEWYARGYELGNAGDFSAAADAFLRSYELQPTSEALFNAALAYENGAATIAAIETYARFLAEPARTESLVPDAERSIEALTREVGVLKGVRYDERRPPAELFVEGQAIELDGFPLLVMPGELELEVVDAEGRHAREFYEISAGEALVVDLRALLRAPAPAPAPEPEFELEPGPSPAELAAAQTRANRAASLRKLSYIGLGLTGATAVAAATVGALALVERRSYETSTCRDFPDQSCPPDFDVGDPEAHYIRYQRYATTGTILAGVSGGLALATLIVGVVSLRYGRAPRTRGGRARVQLQPGPAGVVLHF